MSATCPNDVLMSVVEAAKENGSMALQRVDLLLRTYISDPRLQFLRGSLLAGLGRYPEAREAMSRAVDADPAYEIARFQLGLLEFTSGDADAALATWRAFDDLPPRHPLRLFAHGLAKLAQDDFEQAKALLAEGIRENKDNMPLNADMNLMISTIEKARLDAPEREPGHPAASATQMLLDQFKSHQTKH